MRVNGTAKPGGATLAPGGSGTIFLDATLRRGARVPLALVQSGDAVPVDPSRYAGPHRNALPLNLEVVDFGS